MTNEKPKIANANDYAFFQRLQLVPFNLSFVPNPKEEFERQADIELRDKLEAEASGILACLVRACINYQDIGLCPPCIVLEATKAYQSEEDTIGHFLDDCCSEAKDEKIDRQKLYERYREWCKASGRYPMMNTNFYKKVRMKYDDTKSNGTYHFQGIVLKGNEHLPIVVNNDF